jgi:hypothetical protein
VVIIEMLRNSWTKMICVIMYVFLGNCATSMHCDVLNVQSVMFAIIDIWAISIVIVTLKFSCEYFFFFQKECHFRFVLSQTFLTLTNNFYKSIFFSNLWMIHTKTWYSNKTCFLEWHEWHAVVGAHTCKLCTFICCHHLFNMCIMAPLIPHGWH